jgi:pimeloyl-ACP methyl ester carboxylesterase
VHHLTVHEPPFMQVLPDAADIGRTFQSQVEQALATRGPQGAMEAFVRENAGSDIFDRIDPAVRRRMIGNGQWFFGQELGMFLSWVPGPSELGACRVPVRVLAGRDNRGNYHYRAAEWLAHALGVELLEIPGGHAPYLAQPHEFATALLPLLRGDAAARML